MAALNRVKSNAMPPFEIDRSTRSTYGAKRSVGIRLTAASSTSRFHRVVTWGSPLVGCGMVTRTYPAWLDITALRLSRMTSDHGTQTSTGTRPPGAVRG